ncbi:Crossover junction endonuclease EME1 [Armadillidium vulgare]|nr:Crossover junction endonuclease EME1 [Armadillidium vulgare]
MASSWAVHQISSDEDEVEELDLASRVKLRLQSKVANTATSSQPVMYEKLNTVIPSQAKLHNTNANVNIVSPQQLNQDEVIDDIREFSAKNYKFHDISDDDDDLPDITDITVSPKSDPCGSKDWIESDVICKTVKASQGSSKSSSVNFGTKSKEEQIIEREMKKREREKKKEEKELMKKKAQEEKLLKKAYRPGECLKYISVQIDRHLLEVPEGSKLVSKLLELEIQYKAVEQIIQNSITFFRQNPISREEQDEKEVLAIIKGEDFLNQVYNQIYGLGDYVGNTLISNCKYLIEVAGTSRITIIVCGVDEFFKKQKKTSSKNYRETVLKDTEDASNLKRPKKRKKNDENASNLSQVTRIDVESALVAVQVELGVNSRLFENPSKIADFVAQVAKAIAEKPFKLEKARTNFSWHIESYNVNCVKIDKSGGGLLKLWHQQLRQFNNVGPEAAQAIAKKYPSPQALIKVYRSIPEAEGLKLLADIPVRRGVGVLVNTRKIGPELSSKIYRFFMCDDPNVLL